MTNDPTPSESHPGRSTADLFIAFLEDTADQGHDDEGQPANLPEKDEVLYLHLAKVFGPSGMTEVETRRAANALAAARLADFDDFLADKVA